MIAMVEKDHAVLRSSIERLFVGKLAAEDMTALYAHLRECSSCERIYEDYSKAERALFPAERDLTKLGFERVKDRLFEVKPERARAPVRRSFIRPLITLAAVAAVAVLVSQLPQTEEYGVRSGGDVKLSGDTGLRVLLVSPKEGGGFDVVDLATKDRELRDGDRLKLVYTNLGDRYHHAIAAVVGARGEILQRIGPVELKPGAEDAGFGEALRVSGEWPSGDARVVMIFSREPPRDAFELTAKDGEDLAVRVVPLHIARRGGSE